MVKSTTIDIHSLFQWTSIEKAQLAPEQMRLTSNLRVHRQMRKVDMNGQKSSTVTQHHIE